VPADSDDAKKVKGWLPELGQPGRVNGKDGGRKD